MQNIHVRRYQSHENFQGSVEPEDRSWVVFVDKDGHATFWRRGELAEPIGLPDGPVCDSNEVWYDVEATMLPSEAEALAAAPQPGA